MAAELRAIVIPQAVTAAMAAQAMQYSAVTGRPPQSNRPAPWSTCRQPMYR